MTQRAPEKNYAWHISAECEAIKAMLIAKNIAYGASAFEPIRIFSRPDPIEQLSVRIDDKLSHVARGSEYVGDDTELDLIGYLVLRRVARAIAAGDDVVVTSDPDEI